MKYMTWGYEQLTECPESHIELIIERIKEQMIENDDDNDED